MTTLPRWIAKHIEVSPGGCWRWTGTINWNGYGNINRGTLTTSRLAHRAVYMDLVGPIPDGLDLDHLCRVRACVNPDHLEPVTRSENLRRSPIVGRWGSHLTHCKHGHEFTPENTYQRKDRNGRRQCKTCQYITHRRWVERRHGQQGDYIETQATE